MPNQLTAFHKWLMQVSGGDKAKLINKMRKLALNQCLPLFELLAATGDKTYTPETFEKAAQNLIDQFNSKV